MMSNKDEHKSIALDSMPQPSIMNYSNAGFEQVSGKVERSRDDPQVGMAPANLKAPPVKKPDAHNVFQASAAAASTLTSLKPVFNTGEEYVPDYDPDCDFQIPLRFTKSGRRRATPFPMKLMKVLSTRRFNHIISWTPDGAAFLILRPKAFSTEILPTYFKEAKFSSFTRKLHRWGFQRNLRGPDSGSYWHKNFQRGRLDLLDLMSCYKPREASARAAGKVPKPRKPRAESTQSQQHQREQKPPPVMPPADLIAEAQAIQARAQQAQQQAQMMPSRASLGDVSEDRLNAAIELEVARRLQERVDAASYSRLALMNQGSPPPSYESIGMLQQQQQQHQNLPSQASYEPIGIQQQHRQSLSSQGYAQATSSPGVFSSSHGGGGVSRGSIGGGGMSSYESELNARLQQQANAIRLARSGYDDQQQRFPQRYDDSQHQQQYYDDPNMDSMGRGGA